jgi:hypothetical protein
VTPSTLVWPIFANASPSLASVIGTSFVTIVISAAINDPVASVAMNESIFMTTTTTALITPTPMPTASAMPIAGMSGTPSLAIRWATTTPVSVMTPANERSNTRAESGIVIDRAASAVIALALRICFAVSRFGNVSGTQSENRTMIPSQT